MNRKQVNAFLKVMSKDTSRPVLCSTLVDEFNGKRGLVATDGYVLTIVYLDYVDDSHVGKRITRQALEKWYKLADGKSRLTGEELQDLLEDDVHSGRQVDGKYPEWQKLVPSETQAVDTIAFNADFARIIQDINGTVGVTMKLTGKLGAMIVETDTSYSLIMPLKA